MFQNFVIQNEICDHLSFKDIINLSKTCWGLRFLNFEFTDLNLRLKSNWRKYKPNALESLIHFNRLKKLTINIYRKEVIDFIPNDFPKLHLTEFSFNGPVKQPKILNDFLDSMCDTLLVLRIFSKYPIHVLSLDINLVRLINLEQIKFTNCGLTTISLNGINALINLEHLVLSHNNLRIVNFDSIKDLQNLKTLDISYNEIIDLTYNSINQLPNLISIDASDNSLSKIRNDLFNIPNLKILKLSNNNIQELEIETSNLQHLDLSRNLLQNLPNEICKLKSLVTLNLSKNCLNTLPSSMTKLVDLEELDISLNVKIQIDLPFWRELKKLKKLLMVSCEINTFPTNLLTLENLEYLTLEANEISLIPKDICDQDINILCNLTKLTVTHNNLSTIDGICKIVKLTYLNLSYNYISEIPSEIENLCNLKTLKLRSNNIKSFECLSSLVQLEYLDLSFNRIESFPRKFGSLIQLKTLNLSRNSISEIPTEIKLITKLENLHLSKNPIVDIEPLCSLTNLKILNLMYNEICHFKCLSSLEKLIELDLHSSNMETIKQIIVIFKKSCVLDLDFKSFIETSDKLKDCVENKSKVLYFNLYHSFNGDIVHYSDIPNEMFF